jgi:L-lactate dehydrogenase
MATIARICQAILHNSDLILSVAIVHPEVEGIADVCLSIPMLVNARGARLMAYPLLTDEEREGLRRSAEIVKEASDSAIATSKTVATGSR